MIDLKPNQPDGELKAWQPYNLADGPPPLNDLEVQLNEIRIAELKDPEQRAAATLANQSRDRRVFNRVMRSWQKP